MMHTLPEPYWCVEGFVIEAGVYPVEHPLGVMRVLTTLGWATPIEPSEQEPTVGPAVFTTG